MLNCGIAAYEFEPDAEGPLRPRARAVELRRAARSRRRAEDLGAGRDGGVAVNPAPLDRGVLDDHPLPPVVNGDKDSKGRILVIAGSREVPGAALLAATAAMRAGAGKLEHRDRRERRGPVRSRDARGEGRRPARRGGGGLADAAVEAPGGIG